MAWKNRDHYKRKLGQVITQLDVSLGYLKEFAEVYEPSHSNFSKAAEEIAQILIIAQNITEDLKKAL